MPPLVAVSTYRARRSENGVMYHMLPQAYTHALTQAGVVPVLLPSTLDRDAVRAVYERADGLVLSGGGDIDPAFLSVAQDEARLATEIDTARDGVEIDLVRWAEADDKPLLGICRGHQVINVALGGSLIMDIPSQHSAEITHQLDATQANRARFLHDVDVLPQTQLASIIGDGVHTVNSIHHQAVRELAPGLRASAFALDGIIEGLELPGARFFVGVQWHPEEIYADSPAAQALFEAFGAAVQPHP
ncbi:MAG: gamma-glutamyl-gamma-aminobutyrate hydrolase family protein [Anaerolineales bacterium]